VAIIIIIIIIIICTGTLNCESNAFFPTMCLCVYRDSEERNSDYSFIQPSAFGLYNGSTLSSPQSEVK